MFLGNRNFELESDGGFKGREFMAGGDGDTEDEDK